MGESTIKTAGPRRKMTVVEVLRILRRHRIPKTLILVIGQLVMMSFWELTRASVSGMRAQVGCSMAEMVYTVLARGVAYLVGVILGATAVDCARHKQQTTGAGITDLLLAGSYLLAALVSLVAAWTTDWILLAAALVLHGFVLGTSSILNISTVIHCWKGRSTVPIYALQLTFGASAQFVYTNHLTFFSTEDPVWNNSNWSKIMLVSAYPHAPDLVATLDVPSATWWGIVLTSIGVTSLLFFAFFLWAHFDEVAASKRRPSSMIGSDIVMKQLASIKDEEEEIVESHEFDIKKHYICLAIILMCYILISGSERIFSTQFYVYAQDVGFDADKAVSLCILFWKCFMCGRFFWLLVSIIVSQTTVLALSTMLTTAMMVVFVVWDTSQMLLWWGSAFLGFGLAPAVPALLAWINSRDDNLAAHKVALIYIASSIGSVAYQLIVPFVSRSVQIDLTIYAPLGNTVILSLFLISLAAIDRTVVKSYRDKVKQIYASIKADFDLEKNKEYCCDSFCGYTTTHLDELRKHLRECPRRAVMLEEIDPQVKVAS